MLYLFSDPSYPQLYSSLLAEIRSLGTHTSGCAEESERISNILINMELIIKKLKTISYINRSINSCILSATKIILLLLLLLTLIALSTSTHYHHGLYKQDRNFDTSKKYFSTVISFVLLSNDTMQYTAFYPEYRYRMHLLGNLSANLETNVFCTLHKAIQGMLWGPFPPSFLKTRLCYLNDFEEVIDQSNMQAAPYSLHSVIMLSITTFLWTTCIALQREVISLNISLFEEKITYINMVSLIKMVEKYRSRHNIDISIMSQILSNRGADQVVSQKEIGSKRPRCLSRVLLNSIFLVIFLVNIFGIYAFKSTKIDLDSYWVYIWSIVAAITMATTYLLT